MSTFHPRLPEILRQTLLCLLAVSSWAKGSDLTSEFKLARENHITIVDARRALDSNGERIDREPLWVANVLPGAPGPVAGRDLELERRSPPARIIVIFVHGYETPPTLALEDSNALWQHIKKSNEELRKARPEIPETASLTFFAFLWRGNFGVLNFSRSQQAAKATASSFADFLETVLLEAKGAKIVVITHSLGAEVVLEALASLPSLNGRTLVDSLILVQGAVPFYSVYRWTVSTSIVGDDVEITTECSGQYATAIRSTAQLLYTISGTDRVLGFVYLFHELISPSERPCDTRSGAARALGRPVDTGEWSTIVPPPKIPDPPYMPKSHTFPILPVDSMIMRFKNMQISHPNAVSLSIDRYEDTSTDLEGRIFPGHSVLFESNGRYIVRDLWKRVAGH
jgi:pimeloyl-ACP methyl ester carboxylesterase